MHIYDGEFENWSDVSKQFDIAYKEPEHVYASYDRQAYDGTAFVLYFNNPYFYYVYGSHCSCYGLEGQWEPEIFTRKQIQKLIKTTNDYRFYGIDKKIIRNLYKELGYNE